MNHSLRLFASTLLTLALASCSQQSSNLAPTVRLNASKTSLSGAASITLTAEASDDKGVSKVEFYKGTTKLAEDTTEPYTLDVSLSAADNGTHAFSAKAYDAAGKVGSSDAVNVLVDIDTTPPIISLVASSLSLNSAGSITLTASVTDNTGVVKVEFYQVQSTGQSKLGEDTTPDDGFNYSVAVGLEQNGQLKYLAKAFDAQGNSTASAETSVDVNIDVVNPIVSLSTASTSVTSASTITLSTTASDASGIAKVEFYEGNNKLGEDTSSPYSLDISYTFANNGSHLYTAKAIDKRGNSALSSELSISVNIFAWVKVEAGKGMACGLDTGGKAYCWGDNSDGNLGTGGGDSKTPTTVSMPSGVIIGEFATGERHVCALSSSGNAYCWGNSNYGQLGNGHNISSTTPTAVSMPSGVSFTQMAAGRFHTCALGSDSNTYCWGEGGDGQLGNGSANQSQTPTLVTLPAGASFKQLAAGVNYTCALGLNGNAYCWGYNLSGQLGTGNTTSSTTPVSVTMPAGITFSHIMAGGAHTCALGSDAKTYCWGSNAGGQLGNGSTTDSLIPTMVSSPTGVSFTQVTGGTNHTCALGSDGNAYCWGNNPWGQLGNDTTTTSTTPSTVILPVGLSFSQLSGGSSLTCAIALDNNAYCWGRNNLGQLGNGSTTQSTTPALVSRP